MLKVTVLCLMIALCLGCQKKQNAEPIISWGTAYEYPLVIQGKLESLVGPEITIKPIRLLRNSLGIDPDDSQIEVFYQSMSVDLSLAGQPHFPNLIVGDEYIFFLVRPENQEKIWLRGVMTYSEFEYLVGKGIISQNETAEP